MSTRRNGGELLNITGTGGGVRNVGSRLKCDSPQFDLEIREVTDFQGAVESTSEFTALDTAGANRGLRRVSEGIRCIPIIRSVRRWMRDIALQDV